MKNRKQTIIIALICLIPLVVGIVLYPQIPDKIVTHWGGNGEPNGYSSKFVGIIVLPLALTLLGIVMPRFLDDDPSNKGMNDKLRNSIIWIIPIICFMCSSITILSALGKQLRVEIIVPAIVGIMLTIMGNYLPKAKQSYTVGIKLPWTLNDEENWNKTHRLGGFLFVVCGLSISISSFFKCRVIVMIISIILMAVVPIIYSYILYRNKQ